jgi:uncharacterized membrane protein YraQ (UPF0718 family)
MLHTFLVTVLTYVREIAEIVMLGFVVAGVINAVVNKDAVARYLGSNLVLANLLGATIGVITPLCCCSAIPTAMALYRAGSRRGPACAFLIATPWFNWYGLTALVIFLGLRVALAVAGSAVLIGFTAGLLIDVLGPRQRTTLPVTDPSSRCACGDACAGVTTRCATPRLFDLTDPWGKLHSGVRFALDSLRELGPWMVVGVLLGAAVETFAPEETFTHYLGGASLLGLLAALLIAAIFSADSLGTLPWVQSLLAKGLGTGSAMTLLVAGVGTNVSTLGPVARVMGRGTAVLYAVSVVAWAQGFWSWSLLPISVKRLTSFLLCGGDIQTALVIM